MKKSLLSVVLCAALLISAMGTMLAMPAAAADDVNVLLGATSVNIPGSEEAASATVTNNADGSVTINFPKDDKSEVVFDCGEAGISVLTNPYAIISIDTDMAFNLCFYDANNAKYILAAGDYYPQFNEQVAGSNADKIVAGKYTDVKIDISGAYRWNAEKGDMSGVVPDNAAIRTVAIVPKGTGKMTISKLTMSDGTVKVDLNTRGDVSGQAWDKTVNLIAGEATNAPAESNGVTSDVKVTKNSDGSVTYGNTAGLWPFASYDFDDITVNKSAALEVDFTVSLGCKTTIYVFMGPATPDSFNDGSYIYVANLDDVTNRDLPAGEYKGIIFMEDVINRCIDNMDAVDKCYNADGDYVITGVKIAATSDAATDNAVTINKLNLLSLAKDAPLPSTTKKEDKTTTTAGGVAPGGTTGANGNTTTVNNGGSTGGNSASTGDVSEAALFIVVAAAAVAVVTLSAVSKKAKSR